MGKFIEIVTKYITDDSDSTLQMLEELRQAESELSDVITQEQLDTAVKEKDDEWRKRYRDAFMTKEAEVDIEDREENEEKMNFEELFSEVK